MPVNKLYLIDEIKKQNPNYRRLQEKSKQELQKIYDKLISENHTTESLNEKINKIKKDQQEEESKYNSDELDELSDVTSDYDADNDVTNDDSNDTQPIEDIKNDVEQTPDEYDKQESETYKKEYDDYLKNNFNAITPNKKHYQDDIKTTLIKFKKNIKYLLKEYDDDHFINDDDYNDIIDIYNEEYDEVQKIYDNYENNLKECDMTFDKSFTNFYKKTMTNIVNEIELFFE